MLEHLLESLVIPRKDTVRVGVGEMSITETIETRRRFSCDRDVQISQMYCRLPWTTTQLDNESGNESLKSHPLTHVLKWPLKDHSMCEVP